MGESNAQVATGVQSVDQVSEALREIVDGSSRVNVLLKEIAAASSEQLDGIRGVSSGVEELDKVTQSNAGSAEELASTAIETSGQVQAVRRLVSGFRFKKDGATTNAGPSMGSAHSNAAPSAPLHRPQVGSSADLGQVSAPLPSSPKEATADIDDFLLMDSEDF